jgi:hypothetical protein
MRVERLATRGQLGLQATLRSTATAEVPRYWRNLLRYLLSTSR